MPHESHVPVDELMRNDGTIAASSTVPQSSPLRRGRWSLAAHKSGAVRDGLSDFVAIRAQLPHLSRSAAVDVLPADAASFAATVLDAIERGASQDELRQVLLDGSFVSDLVLDDDVSDGGVPRLLVAPLMDAFVGHESPVERELRRAAYCDAALAPLSESAKALAKTIACDIPRTVPCGHAMLFADARLRKSLARVVLQCARSHEEVGYLQGMADIAAIVFLTFVEATCASLAPPTAFDALDHLTEIDFLNCEADAWRVVMALIYRFVPVFLDSLNGERFMARMKQLEADVAASNPNLWMHMRRFDVETHLFLYRFRFAFLTRELSARACQRIFLAYLALPPDVDAIDLHGRICVALLNIVYTEALLRTQSFEEFMVVAQSSIAQKVPHKAIIDAMVAEADRIAVVRASFDRAVALRAGFAMLRGAAQFHRARINAAGVSSSSSSSSRSSSAARRR